MRKSLVLFLLALPLLLSAQAQAQNPRVWLDFEQGPVILELDAVNAPITTQNFLAYVNAGYYDGRIFHRIVPDFVVQAGGYDKDLFIRPPILPAIASESNNGLNNIRGSIGMAHNGNVNSARNEFYINLINNANLNADYTVFGKVVFGMPVVDEFGALRRYTNEVPISPPLIRKAVQLQGNGFPIMPQHNGSWLDNNNAGVGFNIEIARSLVSDDGARLLVYWYDYRDGEQLWLLGVGEYIRGATEVSLDLVSWDGMTGPVAFQTPPAGEAYVSVGTLTLRFNDCMNGQFDYELDEYGSGSIAVSRLTLPEGSSCKGF